jgi:DUF4097 and DUF4098 domain-containing protein YvlB
MLLVLATAVAIAGEWKTVDEDRWCREGGWNDAETYCEVREVTIPAGRDVIRVDGGANGGIQVEGWDRDEIRIRAKVKAWDRDDEDDAREIVGNIEIDVDGRVIHAEGPRQKRRQGWSVSYRIMVPTQSNLELEANNGGLAVSDVEGEIYLDTTNGGISISNLAGDVKGRTTNGGLHVELTGKTWKGEGLDVRSTNGGIDLAIPDEYSAELETGTVNGGIEVDFPITVQGRIGKKLKATLGDGGATVRVKTTNGGVRIYRG